MGTVKEMPQPAAEDTERSCLGSVFLNNELFGQLSSLTPKHFSNSLYRNVFSAMNALHEDGIGMDYITVADQMKSLGFNASPTTLSELTNGVPSRTNLEHYVAILNEKKMKRDLLMLAHKASTLAYEPSENPQKILRFIEEEAYRIGVEIGAKETDIFLDVDKFHQKHGTKQIKWRINGIAEVGMNGALFGNSGDGKSPLIRALAVCLASGMDWLDIQVKRCRVALVSREDTPSMTDRFIQRFCQGNGIDAAFNLRDWLWIHSRSERSALFVDNPGDLRVLIDNLKRREIQFLICDVLNVLHARDENSNTEMRQVANCFDRIRDAVGCEVMVLHHTGKGAQDTTQVVNAGRGATAMDGFAEFKIRIRTEDEDNGVRSIRFKSKAGTFQRPFYWGIEDTENGGVTVKRLEVQKIEKKGKK